MQGIDLDQLVQTAESEIEALEVERTRKRNELGSLSERITLLQKMIRVAKGTENGQKPEKKRAKKPTTRTVSSDRIDSVLAIFKKNPESEFTTEDIRKETGYSHSSVHHILAQLKDANAINLVRQGGRTGTTRYFKLDIRERDDNA